MWVFFSFFFLIIIFLGKLMHSWGSSFRVYSSPVTRRNIFLCFSFCPNSFMIVFLKGISLKTQELYAIVFLARYLDLFTDFISLYNTVMKLVFIGSSLAIVWCMREHRMVRRTYDKELDTFRHYFLVGGCFVLALILHEKFTFQEVSHC